MFDPALRLPFPGRRVLLATLLPVALSMAAVGCAPKPPVDAPPASVVFFNAFSADLDTQAQGVINEIAEDARANPKRTVIVAGYADKIGTPAANKTLSELRAQVVADALVARGIDRSRIIIQPRGPTDRDPGLESRRVEVTYGH